MQKYIVLYNPLSHKGKGLREAKKVETFLRGTDFSYQDATALTDIADFIQKVPTDTKIIFTGGDGTVNRMLNIMDRMNCKRDILYFPAGTGNDFLNDLNRKKSSGPFSINEYLRGLPTVKVNDIECKFVNAIGLGLDGYCCEENDRLKAKGQRKSYAAIAAEGLLYKFKPFSAKVTIDGVTKTYDKVYMVPTMFGRFYGGGIEMGACQDRKNPDHLVTSVVVSNVARMVALVLFPQIIAGKGEKYPQYLRYEKGRHIICEIDRPIALQIDGDTVTNVTRYEVIAADPIDD